MNDSDRASLDKDSSLEEVEIRRLQVVLTSCSREKDGALWASTHLALSGHYFLRGGHDDLAMNTELSIQSSLAALEFYTRESNPLEFARANFLLAVAFRNRRGSEEENTERAIEYYRLTLTVYTQKDLPTEWAMVRHNMGCALMDRAGNRAENVERALECFKDALTVYLRCPTFDYAWSTTKLADAYSHRVLGDRGQNIRKAIVGYEIALIVLKSNDFATERSEIQSKLASLRQLNGPTNPEYNRGFNSPVHSNLRASEGVKNLLR